MTAKEKLDIQLLISRSVGKVLDRHELKYIDATIMLLGMIYAFIEMFVRNDIAGCKKNIKKRRKIVNKIISDYLDYRLNPDPESLYAYKDDTPPTPLSKGRELEEIKELATCNGESDVQE